MSGKYNQRKAHKAWVKMFNQYLQEFGNPKEYVNYIELKVQAMNMYDQAINENQSFKYTLAKIKSKEADALLSISEPEKLSVVLFDLHKRHGVRMTAKTTTVAEYYSARKAM